MLRVPLNAPDEVFAVDRDCLDKSVLRFSHDSHIRRSVFDSLMMKAVDREFFRFQQLMQRRSGNNPDVMHGDIARRRLAVHDFCSGLRWQILPERPAEPGVDKLNSAADSQQRQIVLHCIT